MPSDTVREGVALIRVLDYEELTLKEVMDRLELLTSNPKTTRRILDEAEREGLIQRQDSEGMVSLLEPSGTDVESGLVKKSGEFSCNRCGQSITTGYFINLDVGTLGPFGSTCVQKVTGQE